MTTIDASAKRNHRNLENCFQNNTDVNYIQTIQTLMVWISKPEMV